MRASLDVAGALASIISYSKPFQWIHLLRLKAGQWAQIWQEVPCGCNLLPGQKSLP